MKEWDRKYNLVRELVVKDLKIRYSRPMLGFLWAFLSPFLMVVIFYIIFGLILKVKIEEAPFVLYLMSGVFPWVFFQDSVLKSTTSLVDNKNLIRESDFPHYLVPVSIVFANFISFLPSLLIMITSSLFILKGLPIFILLLPFVLILHLAIIIGLSVIASILYVKWRDLKYLLDAILLLVFYLTPTCYSLSAVKDSFSSISFKIYLYNPFVGILALYRISLFKGFIKGTERYFGLFPVFIIQLIVTIVIFVALFYLYKRKKNTINDYLSY
ncbi:MAG: hypothetical protein A2047_00410 [Omnitrophica bacterium GWA2_41_15]|nr:MAG: hypothetical protein A2047_00410 [Omnitrophica bacterium GWA2_41_15]HAZ10988.1 hypothetical protein [Candidatus Omnitrophota bacterium]